MKHKHHIIPKHMGGTDDPSNLIELTVEEHAESHRLLHEKYGKKEDLCAYYMLSGKNKDPEFVRLRASLGGKALFKKRKLLGIPIGFSNMNKERHSKMCSEQGKIQGKINSENGHIQKIQKTVDVKKAGKLGGKSTIRSGKGSFANNELRLISATKGGKIQGKINSENGHLERINKEYWNNVKNGIIKRKKKKWYYNKETNDSLLLNCGDDVPKGYIPGRKIKKK